MQLVQDERKVKDIEFFTPLFSLQTCDRWCVIRHQRMSFFDLISLSLPCIIVGVIILGLIFGSTDWNLSKSQFWVTDKNFNRCNALIRVEGRWRSSKKIAIVCVQNWGFGWLWWELEIWGGVYNETTYCKWICSRVLRAWYNKTIGFLFIYKFNLNK